MAPNVKSWLRACGECMHTRKMEEILGVPGRRYLDKRWSGRCGRGPPREFSCVAPGKFLNIQMQIWPAMGSAKGNIFCEFLVIFCPEFTYSAVFWRTTTAYNSSDVHEYYFPSKITPPGENLPEQNSWKFHSGKFPRNIPPDIFSPNIKPASENNHSKCQLSVRANGLLVNNILRFFSFQDSCLCLRKLECPAHCLGTLSFSFFIAILLKIYDDNDNNNARKKAYFYM